MKQLEAFGWLKDINDGSAELSIVFDNCIGQNKNNMVIRLVPYLVESNFFSEVNFHFFVAGQKAKKEDTAKNHGGEAKQVRSRLLLWPPS